MRSTLLTALTGALLALGTVGAGLAGADPGALAQVDCDASYKDGPTLRVSCYNADTEPARVDLMYVCSTPLDFDRRMFFTEPGFPVGPGSTLRLTRDCGPEQVVLSYQVWPLTQGQLRDQSARQDQIREKRDRQAGR